MAEGDRRPLGRPGSTSHGRAPVVLVVAMLGLVAAAAGCAPVGPTATPGATGSATLPSPAASAASGAPVTPAPSVASPTVAPSGTGGSTPSAEPCPIVTQRGLLASDRLIDVVVDTSGTADFVTFEFGDPSLPAPPQGSSHGELEAAVPPYTQGASGLPIEVDGDRVAIVRFTGMSIVADTGTPTYEGALDLRPDLPALRTVVNYDMFEGVVAWYIGFDGDGCVTLRSDPRSVTVVIDHPAG